MNRNRHRLVFSKRLPNSSVDTSNSDTVTVCDGSNCTTYPNSNGGGNVGITGGGGAVAGAAVIGA